MYDWLFLIILAEEVNEEQDDNWHINQIKSTIKSASPFTVVFNKIQAEVSECVSGEENLLYNINLINYLQNFYMPYIFIWSGYVFRNMDPSYSLTKIDQGCIEKYFGTIKRIRGHQPIVPAKHVLHSLRFVLANSIIFTGSQQSLKRKRKEDECEQNNVEAVSEWSSKNIIKSVSNKKNLILARKKKQNMGFQKPQKVLHNFNNKQKLATKDEIKIHVDTCQNTDLKVEAITLDTVIHSQENSIDLIVDEVKSERPKNQDFCYACQLQFKTVGEMNQHKTSKKHQKNVDAHKTKFIVGDEIITNNDYELLISEKGWLSDSVRYVADSVYVFYNIFLIYYRSSMLI